MFLWLCMCTHWNAPHGVATRSRWAECPPWQRKNCQKSVKRGGKREKNQEKIRGGGNREKEGKKRKNQEEKAKIGKVLSLCPSWQIGLAMLLSPSSSWIYCTNWVTNMAVIMHIVAQLWMYCRDSFIQNIDIWPTMHHVSLHLINKPMSHGQVKNCRMWLFDMLCGCGVGGARIKKGGTSMSGDQDPLFTPLLPFFRSPVAAWFSSLDPNFEQKYQILTPTREILQRKFFSNFSS